ncbi:cation channel sperm-associated protein 4-like [Hydractinia symbiolongicarpus]|uniref:cation channel sperm-associated protein 4-like n=1 Tax=Hydractinia symbiolongicarpus TaxID=13093 RepID=UPI00254F85FD|nr:cation channel sperm-associated protein 4-like [Hydractinia symbiolongicarpus]
MQSTVKKWKKLAQKQQGDSAEVDNNALSVKNSGQKKSFINTFRMAVDKVKLKSKNPSTCQMSVEDSKDEFKTVFNLPKATRRGVTVLQEVEQEVKGNILKNIPPMTDEEVIEFTSTELVGRFLNSKYFRYAILSFIITNSILIAVQTNRKLEREYNHIFKAMDQCIMTIFVCEIVLKWYHGFRNFWKQGWNILDFCIVLSLLVGPHVIPGGGGGRGVIRILRVLRAFRSLRSISSLPGLQIVVQTILQSIPDMTNIVVLLVIIMLVFSVIGITLFRHVIPDRFGDLSTSMFSLFICVTQDGWMEIFEAFQKKGEVYYYGGGVFLILFIALGAFIFANLVVAVVVTNLECAVKDVKKEEQQQARELEMKGKLAQENDDVDAEIVKGDGISSKVFHNQMPLLVPDLSGIDVRNIEHYFVILGAMEENYRVYQTLKSELTVLFNEVCELNQSAMEEGVIESDAEEKNRRKSEAFEKVANAGDIMSGLMTMEDSNLISSKTKNSLHGVLVESADVAFKSRLSSLGSTVGNRLRRRRSTGAKPENHRRSTQAHL